MSPIAAKPTHAAFDRLTFDAGVLVLAEIDRRFGIAEMIRFWASLIAAGYPGAGIPLLLRFIIHQKSRLPSRGSLDETPVEQQRQLLLAHVQGVLVDLLGVARRNFGGKAGEV